jgi:hypothetical protein
MIIKDCFTEIISDIGKIIKLMRLKGRFLQTTEERKRKQRHDIHTLEEEATFRAPLASSRRICKVGRYFTSKAILTE